MGEGPAEAGARGEEGLGLFDGDAAVAVVEVEDGDSAETLAGRILTEEHRIYSEALRRLFTRPWRIEERRVVLGQ